MTDASTSTSLTEQTFTPDRTRTRLERACRLAGLDPTGAVVLRHHTNAVYRLTTAPVVVKVARPSQTNVRDVVRLVRWATENGIPTVGLLDDVQQPVEIGGCAIPFWHYLSQTRPVTAGDIAGPLRALHTAPHPPTPTRNLDAPAAIKWALDQSQLLTDTEREARPCSTDGSAFARSPPHSPTRPHPSSSTQIRSTATPSGTTPATGQCSATGTAP